MLRKTRHKRIIKIPDEYLEVLELEDKIFPHIYQFENGLRILVNQFLTTCYGPQWWDISLKIKLPKTWQYAQDQQNNRNSMPWIGDSAKVKVLPIHLITLGQLEEIVRTYQSDCIPQIFPTLDFFTGHMNIIKRVRNMYTHMFPCITLKDCRFAKNEITILSQQINTKLSVK